MGLVCVPEGCVHWDIQVIIAEEVGIIRNFMDDRRRVVRLGTWQWATSSMVACLLISTLGLGDCQSPRHSVFPRVAALPAIGLRSSLVIV